MKRALKITGIILMVVILLLVGLGLLAKVLITPERVKAAVLPRVEKAIHRPVRLGEIKVSIFSGIILKDLTIMEQVGEEVFLKAAQARLRYQLWPLLAGKVVVDEIGLDAPRISVVRRSDGSFNYSDILGKKESEGQAKPQAKELDMLIAKIALSDGQIRYEDRRDAAVKTLVTITGIEVTSRDISVQHPFPFKVRGQVAGIALALDGKASDIGQKPAIDAVLTITAADVKKTAAEAPPALAGKLKALDPSGAITARIHLVGPVAAPKELPREGEVRLDNVQFAMSGQRPALAGDMILKGKELFSRNLTLTAGPNKLTIAFAVANFLATPLALSSSVTADRFDLDPFLKKGAGPATAGGSVDKAEPGPLKLPVNATGTVQVGQTAYKGLAVTQLNLKYRLVENVLAIEQLTGSVAGGSFSGTSRVLLDRQGFGHSTRVTIQGVQAEPMVAAFAPKAAGAVSGALSLNAEMKGKGVQFQSLKNNLTGRGDFAITNGKLTGTGLVQDFARFINIEQLRVVQFSKFAGDFRIDKGKVIIDSAVAGKDVQITPKGTAGLDKSLDLSLITRLSPELSSKVARGDLGKFITDDKGWSILPIKVGGTFSSPSFRLDSAAVREQVKTKAKEKIQQTIEEKLFKKKSGEPQRPEQEILERGLRGIFGK